MSAETICYQDQQTTIIIDPRSSAYVTVEPFVGLGPILFSFGCSKASVITPLSQAYTANAVITKPAKSIVASATIPILAGRSTFIVAESVTNRPDSRVEIEVFAAIIDPSL